MIPTAEWLPAFIQGGAFIVVAFVVYHLMTKHLPTMTKKFAEQIEQQDRIFLEELKDARASFAHELQQERAARVRDNDRIGQALERQNTLLLYLVGQFKPMSESERAVLLGAKPKGETPRD